MKNKIHFFYLEVKYAFLFIILTIKVPLRLNDSRVKMNVTEITDTVDSFDRIRSLYDLNTNCRNLFSQLLISATMAM